MEIDIGVLFADVRGFTSLAEKLSPEETARLLNRLYVSATHVLAHADAVIDKLVGDEVMGLFIPGFAGPDFVGKMCSAAEDLLGAVGYGSGEEPWLALGVGLDFGPAFVGNVGSDEVKDFTALGDVVNTASRLQAEARPGQIVMGERVYERVPGRYAGAEHVQLELRGKSQPVSAFIIDKSAPVSQRA